MRKKVGIVLFVMFGIQLIASCCPDETFEYLINGVAIRPLVLQGNQFIEVTSQDNIDKSSLLIEVAFTGDRRVIGSVLHKVGRLGFESAHATSCPDQTILYANRVTAMSVLVRDVNTNAFVDITNSVEVDQRQLSIGQFLIEESPSLDDVFLLSITDVSGIANQAEIIVRAQLDNNVGVEAVTTQLNFN